MCKKTDWEKLDNECCKRFEEFIKSNPSKMERKYVADYFGLKDKTLRMLPKLRSMIKREKER